MKYYFHEEQLDLLIAILLDDQHQMEFIKKLFDRESYKSVIDI